MRRILTTGALLAALAGASTALLACTDGETSENPFQIDASIDAIDNSDATSQTDAAENFFIDAHVSDAETTD
jgi:hypothetical protein